MTGMLVKVVSPIGDEKHASIIFGDTAVIIEIEKYDIKPWPLEDPQYSLYDFTGTLLFNNGFFIGRCFFISFEDYVKDGKKI